MELNTLTPDERQIEAQRYALTQAQAEKVFNTQIRPLYFNDSIKAQAQPVVEMLGGQPAAGKSRLINQKTEELKALGGAVVINGDDFRQYHPSIDSIKAAHGKDFAFYTDRDSGRWVEMMIKEAQRQKVNVVLEGTMRRPEITINTASSFKEAGYQVHASVLAVKPEQSWYTVHHRYEDMMKSNPHTARFTQKHTHDEAVIGLANTVGAIEKSLVFDKLEIQNKALDVVYQNTATGGKWELQAKGQQEIQAFHGAALTESERLALKTDWEALINRMQLRHADTKEIQQVQNQYREFNEANFNKTQTRDIESRAIGVDKANGENMNAKVIANQTENLLVAKDGFEKHDGYISKKMNVAGEENLILLRQMKDNLELYNVTSNSSIYSQKIDVTTGENVNKATLDIYKNLKDKLSNLESTQKQKLTENTATPTVGQPKKEQPAVNVGIKAENLNAEILYQVRVSLKKNNVIGHDIGKTANGTTVGQGDYLKLNAAVSTKSGFFERGIKLEKDTEIKLLSRDIQKQSGKDLIDKTQGMKFEVMIMSGQHKGQKVELDVKTINAGYNNKEYQRIYHSDGFKAEKAQIEHKITLRDNGATLSKPTTEKLGNAPKDTLDNAPKAKIKFKL